MTRQSFVKEHINSGKIKLEHLRTDLMPADMLTKPMSPTNLSKFLSILGIFGEK
jgi:hypothetical protein